MKTRVILMLLFPLIVWGQVPERPQGNLHVQVSGDTVLLAESMAVRNCGAAYDMHVMLGGNTLYWYQVDTGATAVCLCTFNLSVTVDSMPTGHYTARVYFTQCPDCPPPGADTVYVGSVEFDITEQNSNAAISTIGQDQSDCIPYNGTGDERERLQTYSFHPNPVHDVLHFVTADANGKEIRIFDVQGRIIAARKFEEGAADISLAGSPAGVYILVYSNGSATYHEKILKER